ncbi:MAG: DUF302 domain-containing protein [Geminicoccaceae bacterium]|nr:DUF302 domain-containing protein [Geminicoccaceae bacterium]
MGVMEMRLKILLAALLLPAASAVADPLPDAIDGWAVHRSAYDYPTLVDRLDAAIGESSLNKLSAASATVGAKNLGLEIPGNMVVHAFAPQFAVRMLEASIAAGYEAPLRFYLTEDADGTATLSYKTASFVFAPYADGGEELKLLAAELEEIQAAIAAAAVGS